LGLIGDRHSGHHQKWGPEVLPGPCAGQKPVSDDFDVKAGDGAGGFARYRIKL
jgi:hypothetical protein